MGNKQILSKLLQPTYEKDHQKWQDYLNTDNASILWYPSAGDDFMLFVHLEQDNLNHLFEKTPTVIYSSIDEYPCFFNEEPFIVQDLEINITLRIPLLFNFTAPEFEAELNEPPNAIAAKTKVVSSSGINNILKPKTKEEIEKTLKERNMNWTDIKPPKNHHIWLFKVDITSPQNEIRSQYVLYFFWDNIEFFEFIVRDQNLPVNVILSNRDRMDDEIKYCQFWQLLSANQSVNHIICDDKIFDNMDRVGDELVHVAWQDDILVQLQYLSERQWNNIDSVKFYKVL